MTIMLADELEELIKEKVRSGAYQSADEVVAAGLQLLDVQEEGRETLRREIVRGIEDTQQGGFSTYTTDAELDSLSDLLCLIIQNGRTMLSH